MNRPLLLLICDFLLLSMFALARFDVPQDAIAVDPSALITDGDGLADPGEAGVSEDGLLRTLEQSLVSEREEKIRQQQELEEAQNRLARTSRSLESLQEQYEDARKNLDAISNEKQSTESEVRRLEDALNRSRSQLVTLESMSREEKEKLEEELSRKERDLIIQETRLQEVQLALRQKEDILSSAIREQATLEQRLVDAEQTVTEVLREKDNLEAESTRLASRNQLLDSTVEILKTEKQMISENLSEIRQTLQLERQKNQQLQDQAVQLTANVADLASQSEEIREEIRRNTVLSPHEIFSSYISRQVFVRFEYTTTGLVGGRNRREAAIPAILFRPAGSNGYWTVFHINDSPIDVRGRVSIPEELSIWLQFGTTAVELDQISFHRNDPAIVLGRVSIPDEYAGEVPEPFGFPDNPLQFDEAVVIQPTEQNYGTSKFSIIANLDNLIHLQDGGVLSTLLGKFNARRGNLLFSRSGDFLGIMRSGSESVLLKEFTASGPMLLGGRFDQETARRLLERIFEINSSGVPPNVPSNLPRPGAFP